MSDRKRDKRLETRSIKNDESRLDKSLRQKVMNQGLSADGGS